MMLTPTVCAVLVTIVVSAIVMAAQDDPRAVRWIRDTWSNTVGAWFARRRIVGRFTDRRYKRIKIGEPDQHSAGIMSSRRDINTGVWS